MSNTKKQLEEINVLISKMEQNHFLLPDSWSDTIEMTNHEWSYRTYVAAPRNLRVDRYINIEIYVGTKKIHDINFRGNDIIIEKKLGGKSLSVTKVLFYVGEIFKEKHSFENHYQGKRKIRKEISRLNEDLRSIKKQIQSKKNELEGVKSIES